MVYSVKMVNYVFTCPYRYFLDLGFFFFFGNHLREPVPPLVASIMGLNKLCDRVLEIFLETMF